MNRRQFLGASLATSIASAVLPWDRFIEWFKALFAPKREPFFGVDRASYPERLSGVRVSSFSDMLKRLYPKEVIERLTYKPNVLFVSPKTAREFEGFGAWIDSVPA